MGNQNRTETLILSAAEEKIRITKLRKQERHLKVGYSLMAACGLGVVAAVVYKADTPKPLCTSISQPQVVTIIPERHEMWTETPPSKLTY